MSACRECNEPIEWAKRAGRNVPLIPGTQDDHRDVCSAAPTKPCKTCGAETLYRKNVKVNPDGNKHECQGVVPAGISYSPRRSATMSEVTTYELCPREGYYRWVLGLPDTSDRTDAEAGILGHESIARLAVVRHKAGELAKPVTVEDLLAALDVVVAGKRWTKLEAVTQAREQLVLAAPRIDLSFALSDEHGVYAERGYEVPVGDGILAGSTADLVSRVGNVILVEDWKFSNWYDAPKRNPREMFQVALGLAWAHANWPGLEARFVLRFLCLGEVVEVPWDEELDASARVRARAYVERRRAQRENEDAWTPNFGAHCARCSYTSRCPAFKTQMAKKLPEREPVTLPEVAEELYRWSPIASVASKYVDRLKAAGKALVAAELGSGRGQVMAGRYPVTLKTITRRGYTVEPSTYQVLDVEDPIGLADAQSHEIAGVPEAPALTDTIGLGAPSATPEVFSTPIVSPLPNGEPTQELEVQLVPLPPITGALDSACRACEAIDEGADPYTPHSQHGSVVHAAIPENPKEAVGFNEASLTRPAPSFTLEDGLSRLGRGQVRHVEELIGLKEADGAGNLSSSILNLASRWHGEDRVKALWHSVGGEMTGGQRPRRKALTAGQLRRLMLELPAIFRVEEANPAESVQDPAISAALSKLEPATGEEMAPW